MTSRLAASLAITTERDSYTPDIAPPPTNQDFLKFLPRNADNCSSPDRQPLLSPLPSSDPVIVQGGTDVGYLPLWMPVFAFVATALGLMGVIIANHSRCPVSICWGRRLYLFIFLLVAASCLTMALTWPRGVLPSCLAMGALFLAMLWHPSTPIEEGDLS